ncbi:hypothetical protein BGZ76_005484, partial [Entomortierella beljakovae]
ASTRSGRPTRRPTKPTPNRLNSSSSVPITSSPRVMDLGLAAAAANGSTDRLAPAGSQKTEYVEDVFEDAVDEPFDDELEYEQYQFDDDAVQSSFYGPGFNHVVRDQDRDDYYHGDLEDEIEPEMLEDEYYEEEYVEPTPRARKMANRQSMPLNSQRYSTVPSGAHYRHSMPPPSQFNYPSQYGYYVPYDPRYPIDQQPQLRGYWVGGPPPEKAKKKKSFLGIQFGYNEHKKKVLAKLQEDAQHAHGIRNSGEPSRGYRTVPGSAAEITQDLRNQRYSGTDGHHHHHHHGLHIHNHGASTQPTHGHEHHYHPTTSARAPSVRAPSVAGSRRPESAMYKQPSVAGSRAPSVAGSQRPQSALYREPSVAGSRAPSVAGSQRPQSAIHRQPSVAGSRAPSVAGSQRSQSALHRQPSVAGSLPPQSVILEEPELYFETISDPNPKYIITRGSMKPRGDPNQRKQGHYLTRDTNFNMKNIKTPKFLEKAKSNIPPNMSRPVVPPASLRRRPSVPGMVPEATPTNNENITVGLTSSSSTRNSAAGVAPREGAAGVTAAGSSVSHHRHETTQDSNIKVEQGVTPDVDSDIYSLGKREDYEIYHEEEEEEPLERCTHEHHGQHKKHEHSEEPCVGHSTERELESDLNDKYELSTLMSELEMEMNQEMDKDIPELNHNYEVGSLSYDVEEDVENEVTQIHTHTETTTFDPSSSEPIVRHVEEDTYYSLHHGFTHPELNTVTHLTEDEIDVLPFGLETQSLDQLENTVKSKSVRPTEVSEEFDDTESFVETVDGDVSGSGVERVAAALRAIYDDSED